MTHDFGKRAVAFIIDSIIVGIVSSIIQMIISIGSGSVSFIGVNVSIGADDALSIVIYILYYLYFATQNEGITFGKQAMNLEIRYASGAPLPRKKLIEREILKAVLMPISIISLILVLVRDDDKSLHDMVMDTLVYTSDSLTNQEPDIFEKTEDDDIFDDYYK